MVKRLVDYKWSSYRAFAYAEPMHDWLQTDLILSQFTVENKYEAYRRKVQEYSGEEKKMFEDIHMGLVAGSKSFAKKIKKKYMPEKPHEEIPQQKKKTDDCDMAGLLANASQLLDCDLEHFKAARRISQSDKVKRDIIIYLLWKIGAFTNKEIAENFGLSYSAVSRRISLCGEMVKSDEGFKNGFNMVKSLIKM